MNKRDSNKKIIQRIHFFDYNQEDIQQIFKDKNMKKGNNL
jgi:hypothetical protein